MDISDYPRGIGSGGQERASGRCQGRGRRHKQNGRSAFEEVFDKTSLHSGAVCFEGRHTFCPRGRRRGRILNHGDLRTITLALIGEKSRHGYDIIKAIEEKVGGTYTPSPGVIYPTLNLLEEMGYITANESDGKRLYSITSDGQSALKKLGDELNTIEARLATISERAARVPEPEIVRAMENFRQALHLRAMLRPLNATFAAHIAKMIDGLTNLVESED